MVFTAMTLHCKAKLGRRLELVKLKVIEVFLKIGKLHLSPQLNLRICDLGLIKFLCFNEHFIPIPIHFPLSTHRESFKGSLHS